MLPKTQSFKNPNVTPDISIRNSSYVMQHLIQKVSEFNLNLPTRIETVTLKWGEINSSTLNFPQFSKNSPQSSIHSA